MTNLNPQDEAAIHHLVVKYVETWNSKDLEGMHAIDTEDVEWINVRGNHWLGRPVVYKGHAALLGSALAKTTLEIIQARIRGVVPNVALAVARFRFGPLVVPGGNEIPFIVTIASFVMVLSAGDWKIKHFQNTIVDAEAEHNDPTTWEETGYVRKKPA
jgi:uncharacterized protein (TIGR02246 family)